MKAIASLSPVVRARTLRSFSAYFSRVHKTQALIANASLPSEDLEPFMPPMADYQGTSAVTLAAGLEVIQAHAQESLVDWLTAKGLYLGGNVSALSEKKLYLLKGVCLLNHETLAHIERVRARGILDAIRLSPKSGCVEIDVSQPKLETQDGLYECYVLFGSESTGIQYSDATKILTLTVPLRGDKTWQLKGLR